MAMLVSTDTRAADNLEFNKYFHSTDMPKVFYNFGGAASMANKKYSDDDGKQRSDKVYYTISHIYRSSFKVSDLDQMLNPSSGRLGYLFEDTEVKKSKTLDSFDVLLEISTPLKNFICENILTFKKFKSSGKDTYQYTFSHFNMVFTDMVIQVEVQAEGSESLIVVSQVAAVKGSTYEKLKTYFAVGKFEKALKLNLSKFKYRIGGY